MARRKRKSKRSLGGLGNFIKRLFGRESVEEKKDRFLRAAADGYEQANVAALWTRCDPADSFMRKGDKAQAGAEASGATAGETQRTRKLRSKAQHSIKLFCR